MKKKLWHIPVIVAVLLALAAGGVYLFWYRPLDQAYRSAVEANGSAPFDEAISALDQAVGKLSGQPLFDEKANTLRALRTERIFTEIDRRIADGDLDGADALLSEVGSEPDSERTEQLRIERTFRAAQELEAAGAREDAIALYRSLGAYRDASALADALEAAVAFDAAKAVFSGRNYDEGIAALRALGTEQGNAEADKLTAEKEAWQIAYRAELIETAKNTLAAGAWHTAAAGKTPWIAGDARYPAAPEAASKVVSGLCSVLYLKDGRVLPAGETFGSEAMLAAQTDVTDAALGLTHALLLHRDGTVTHVGSNAFSRADANDWTGIVSVAAGAWHSVGAKTDGTVLAVGDNSSGQCDVSEWTNVNAVAAGLWHTVGLNADGTVVAVGDNTYGQCDVSGWTDIAEIFCGACHTVGLKTDGTVVAAGDNSAGQCELGAWKDIAFVACGAYHTAGVRLDGTVVSAGILPAALPEGRLFDSEWVCDPVQSTSGKQATAYIEGAERTLGPWLYLDETGAVTICLDDSEERMPFRSDLFARAGRLPVGRLTNPDATGNVIRMPSELPADQAKQHHAVLAFTGDYIGYTANRKGVMLRGGKVYYDRAETTTLAILPDGTLAIYEPGETTAEQLLAAGVKDSFSFGPVLVRDGVSQIKERGNVTMRVALGYSDPYHFITVVTMRDRLLQRSYEMMADTCVRYGCRIAYNLDGGHSSSLVFLGRELSTISLEGWQHVNIRGLSDVITFLESPDVQ